MAYSRVALNNATLVHSLLTKHVAQCSHASATPPPGKPQNHDAIPFHKKAPQDRPAAADLHGACALQPSLDQPLVIGCLDAG
jgi:hypothetical protein